MADPHLSDTVNVAESPRLGRHPFRLEAPGSDYPYCTRAGCGLPAENAVHELDLLPALPYAGTSGWSGSVTSQERAIAADASGVTGDRQRRTLAYLAAMGGHGVTVKELREITGWHHGQASSVLSNLHKGDPEHGQPPQIDRLAERRDRCEVYVLPEYVNGRETRQQGRQTPVLTDTELRALTDVEAALRTGQPTDPTDVTTICQAVRRVM